MPVRTKICGVSTTEALDAAIGGGASHIGFVFFARSPRAIDAEAASALSQRAAGRAQIVGLFVDPDPDAVDAVRSRIRLDAIQLHGDERPGFVGRLRASHGIEVWKAVPVRTSADLAGARRYLGAASHILYDAKPPAGATLPGGNGIRFDWKLLENFDHPLPWLLSGGLDAGNVADAISITGARLVDVSSGVERAPGVKDVDKIAAFLQAVARS